MMEAILDKVPVYFRVGGDLVLVGTGVYLHQRDGTKVATLTIQVPEDAVLGLTANYPKAGSRLKVYGWQGYRQGTGHTREIAAARSMAELRRINKDSRRSAYFNICETGNADEIAAAMDRPRVILYRPLDARTETWLEAGGQR